MGITKVIAGHVWEKDSMGFKTEKAARAEARRREKAAKEFHEKYPDKVRRKYRVKKMEPPVVRSYAPYCIFTRDIQPGSHKSKAHEKSKQASTHYHPSSIRMAKMERRS
jgi:hypothetical protein